MSSLHNLPRSCARLCLRIRQFLGNTLTSGDRIVIGFSGGADSTALALILFYLDFKPYLAHLDHCLRLDSSEDAQAVAAFAHKFNLPFIVKKIDISALSHTLKISLEAAGRHARYSFLEEARQNAQATWIALGHQLNDLCEDQIMRYIRGTGWAALGGMNAIDTQRHLIRPLLGVTRKEIETFLRDLHQEWREDASNQDSQFTRNRIRNHLIPLLETENPHFSKSVKNLWQLAQIDATYWQHLLSPILSQVEEKTLPYVLVENQNLRLMPKRGQSAIFLRRHIFTSLPTAVRLRIWLAMIHHIRDLSKSGQARADTLLQFDAACQQSKMTKYLAFSGGILMISCADGVYVLSTSPLT